MATRRRQIFFGADAPASPALNELWYDTTGGAGGVLKRCTVGGPTPTFQALNDIDAWNAKLSKSATREEGLLPSLRLKEE
ncbi:MAG: hypothetical protein QME81_06965 [bacterium]|nr:hypothetical protein [bacterium]